MACPCVGERAIVVDSSDSEVFVAVLAHVGLPREVVNTPKIVARAR